MAKTPRTWTGARTPSGLKRVRSAERRHAILGPRRSAAKTLVRTALEAATAPIEGVDAQAALVDAISALDRAAKVGALHPNAVARRKSRLVRKVNAALVGTEAAAGHVVKTVGRAAAQKAARARIAASKADKAKGAQTAAGKARAALSKTARAEAAAGEAAKAARVSKAAAASGSSATKSTPKAAKSAPKVAPKGAPKGAAKAATAGPKAKADKAPATVAAAKKAPAKKAAKS